MLQMAVCKTGHKVLFSSQINNKDVHLSLLEQTDCGIFFTGLGVHVDDILAARPMKHVVIPELEDLLDQTKAPYYPYEKTYEEAKSDPYVVLHTSGTTGMAVSNSDHSCHLESNCSCLFLLLVLMFLITEADRLEPRLHGHTGSTSSLERCRWPQELPKSHTCR